MCRRASEWRRCSTAAPPALLPELRDSAVQLLSQRQELRALHGAEESRKILLLCIEEIGAFALCLDQAIEIPVDLRSVRRGDRVLEHPTQTLPRIALIALHFLALPLELVV